MRMRTWRWGQPSPTLASTPKRWCSCRRRWWAVLCGAVACLASRTFVHMRPRALLHSLLLTRLCVRCGASRLAKRLACKLAEGDACWHNLVWCGVVWCGVLLLRCCVAGA